ncbi:MAG: hypothetical protein AB7J63_12100, partial [Vicinamibacterales bacterium]
WCLRPAHLLSVGPLFLAASGLALAACGGNAAVRPPAPAAVCDAPVRDVDTSRTPARIGRGDPAGCTEAALRREVARGGAITFDCGPHPATIVVRSTVVVPADRDTVIDGGGRITLDGRHGARILSLEHEGYRTNRHGLTLQHIALINGRAPRAGFVLQDVRHPSCAFGYPASGGGAAVSVRDARLHVIDVEFRDNAAATPGPDVGGGAIYALASLDVTIVNSRFVGNTGANGGALGLLQSNARIYDSRFESNRANGIGMNYVEGDSCVGVGHPGQGGAGGNGGAISMDGIDDDEQVICGSWFVGNRANELAGAIFRASNIAPRPTRIDHSHFERNSAREGGALFVVNADPVEILSSSFRHNHARTIGAAQIERSRVRVENSTFTRNTATSGIGGALFLANIHAGSVVRNATFADNRADGGAGFFGAAIVASGNFGVYNTVFANNTTRDSGSPMQCAGTATGADNVQWPPDRLVGVAADRPCVAGIRFADPRLGRTSREGAGTIALVPQSDSPLLRAGRDCPAVDQWDRPRDAAGCTIGSLEGGGPD